MTYTKVKYTLHINQRKRTMKNRLEQFRKKMDLTQEELADRLEVSRQTIISLESGRYNPSILLAFRIARLFGVSVEEVFLYEEGANNA